MGFQWAVNCLLGRNVLIEILLLSQESFYYPVGAGFECVLMRLETLKCVFEACFSQFYSARVRTIRENQGKFFFRKVGEFYDFLSRLRESQGILGWSSVLAGLLDANLCVKM